MPEAALLPGEFLFQRRFANAPKAAHERLCTVMPDSTSALHNGNRFNRMEWAGAFGDLGTLIPFVVAYIAVVKMDPFGIILSFGIALIVSGLRYRTPFPVQPMKAIGAVAATQAAQTATIAQATVYAADVVTGLAWLVLGLTGGAN